MRFVSRPFRFAAVLSFGVSWNAQAATPRAAFDATPLEAIAIVAVPDLAGLEREWTAACGRWGLEEVLGPACGAPLARLRESLRLGDAFDDGGPVIAGVLNGGSLTEVLSRGFVMIPAKEPKSLLASMGGEEKAERDTWSVTIQGSPYFASIRGKHVVVARDEATAKSVAADPKRALGDVLSREDLGSIEGLDFVVWIKLEEALKLVKPQIDLFTSMGLLAEAAKGPVGMKRAEMSKRQIGVLLQGLSTLVVGVAIEERSVDLRFAIRARPGSELDQSTRRPQTDAPMLAGLPSEGWLLVAGSRTSSDAVKRQVETELRPLLGVGEAVPGIDKTKYAEFAKMIEEWVEMLTGVRMAVLETRAEPSGAEGLLAVAGLLDVSDARRWIELFGQAVESAKAIFTAEGAGVDGGLKSLLGAVEWARTTEDVGGTAVGRLTVDLSKLGELSATSLPAVRAVLGEDGVCLRVAMVDDRTAMLALGGGRRMVVRAMEAARGGRAAIEESPGVKRIASSLPREREGVAYLAVDRMVNVAPRVARVFGVTDGFEKTMPAFDVPAGMASSGGEHVMRTDIVVPDEAVAALSRFSTRTPARAIGTTPGEGDSPSAEPRNAPGSSERGGR